MYTGSRAFLARRGAVASWWLIANRIVAALLFVAICTLVACDGDCVSVKEVKERIHRVVSIGDSREEVAAAMDRARVKVTYDKYNHRFQAAIFEGCSNLESVIVYLAFDDLDELKEIEVYKERTFW